MGSVLDSVAHDKAAEHASEAGSDGHAAKHSDLTAASHLAGVDYKSFSEAQSASGVDKTSGHLPDVLVPLALEKNVVDEHDKLLALAQREIPEGPARQKFITSMDLLEQRADKQGLTSNQITQTYKQMERMLGETPDSPFSLEQRHQLAGQWMARLAEPSGTTRQGWHDTCGWTYLETRLLQKDPDKITEKLAEVITSGSVTTLDVEKMKLMESRGQNSDVMPTKLMALDRDSLKPDQEAQGLSAHADKRDYVDQIAQVMEDSIRWNSQMRTPAGKIVPPGTMQYSQCAVIERPADALPDGSRADKSCESVVYTDPTTHQKVIADDHGYGFGGGSTTTDLGLVNAIITGRFEPIALQKPRANTEIDTTTALPVGSIAELNAQLAELKKNNGFPFGVLVEVANPGIMEDYLARHPEKGAADVTKDGWHMIAVTGLDADGNVQIYNPWGINRTLTKEELFQAMTKPV